MGNVVGVELVKDIQALYCTLVVASLDLCQEVQGHVFIGVGCQRVQSAVRETILPTGPKGVGPHQSSQICDGSEFRSEGQDRERLF
jgi:hypothetical protein